MRARARTKLQNLWVKSKEGGITGDSLGPLSAVTTLATCLTCCTVAGLDPGLNFDLVCRSQSKQPEISNRHSHPHHQSNTAVHSNISSGDCFPGVRCTFVSYYQIAPPARIKKWWRVCEVSVHLHFFSILYTSSQKYGHTPSLWWLFAL